jgi:hypothetical protein
MTEREGLLAWVDQNFDIECPSQVVTQLQEILWQTHLRAAARPAVVLSDEQRELAEYFRAAFDTPIARRKLDGGEAGEFCRQHFRAILAAQQAPADLPQHDGWHGAEHAIPSDEQAPADAGQASKEQFLAQAVERLDEIQGKRAARMGRLGIDAGQAQALADAELPPLPEPLNDRELFRLVNALGAFAAGVSRDSIGPQQAAVKNLDSYLMRIMRDYGRACMALRQSGDAQLIAEQNKLAKERQEWALQQSEIIRGLKARIAELEAAAQCAAPDERAAFEARYKHLDLSRRSYDDQYSFGRTVDMWDAWQARASLAPAVQARPVAAQPEAHKDGLYEQIQNIKCEPYATNVEQAYNHQYTIGFRVGANAAVRAAMEIAEAYDAAPPAAQPEAKAAPVDAEQTATNAVHHTDTWKHAANKWADTAYSGLQWLRNVEDGTMTDIRAARENMERCCQHAQQVAGAVYAAGNSQGQATQPELQALLEREQRDSQTLATMLRNERARFEFLHSTNKDADGWEWGVARVRVDAAGRIEYLWGVADHSDIDAAMGNVPAQPEQQPVAEVSIDPVVEANRALLLQRSQLGIVKYGTTLASSGLSRSQLLSHLLEELLDGANYAQAELMREVAAPAPKGEQHG